ncbi:MAG: GxxExxY protein [Verrucomicrobia bacterium]|nr:GxxExxY protein [Verrucomicrobiota bacterium]
MHPLFQKADGLSREAIAAAIEVHRHKGPGLIESIYEKCLMHELRLRNLSAVNQKVVSIEYKGFIFEEPLRFDVLIEDCLLLELKAVQELLPIHRAQLLSYMKLLNVPVGLLINFHELRLVDGIVRMILPGANQ